MDSKPNSLFDDPPNPKLNFQFVLEPGSILGNAPMDSNSPSPFKAREIDSNGEGSRRYRWIPAPPIPPQTKGSKPKPLIYYVEKVESEGRIAKVPCGRCVKHGKVCYVGATVRRCAPCILAGISLHKCGVDYENYTRTPRDINMDGGNDGSSPLSSATTSSGTVSGKLTSTSPTLDKKIDELSTNTHKEFEQITRNMDDMDDVVHELTEIIDHLQRRVKELEDTVFKLVEEVRPR